MNSRLSGLYGITDPQLLPNIDTLLSSVEQALQGGMNILQYRAKTASDKVKLQQAEALKQLCTRHQALFIINDDVDLAIKVQADGIHVGRDDLSITAVRKQLGEKMIIGCSCYNRLDLAIKAQRQGADYVAFGRFFPSQTKPQAIQANTALIKQAKLQLDVPLCVIGGITSRNASELIDQGADMIAVIDDLFSTLDIYQQAKCFVKLFDKSSATNLGGFSVE